MIQPSTNVLEKLDIVLQVQQGQLRSSLQRLFLDNLYAHSQACIEGLVQNYCNYLILYKTLQ